MLGNIAESYRRPTKIVFMMLSGNSSWCLGQNKTVNYMKRIGSKYFLYNTNFTSHIPSWYLTYCTYLIPLQGELHFSVFFNITSFLFSFFFVEAIAIAVGIHCINLSQPCKYSVWKLFYSLLLPEQAPDAQYGMLCVTETPGNCSHMHTWPLTS